MHNISRLSYLNVKNVVYSKEFLIGVMAAFAYSMLWVFGVRPDQYGIGEYGFEIGRFLFVIILYAAVSTLRNDIRFNTTKTNFTGVFSRVEIMLSKGMALVMLGIVFYIIVEINNVLVAAILYKKIGVAGFLAFNHLQLFISYVVITATVGSLMLLIVSIMFNENKVILLFIVLFSMVNFFTAAIVTMVGREPEMAQNFSIFMKTPFYNVVAMQQGIFSVEAVVINMLWALLFFVGSMFIVVKREIR